MSNYLKLAKQKYSQSNDVDFDLSFNDFISDCYVRLKPCSYGMRIQQKIAKDLNVKSIQPSLNIGDVEFGNKMCEIKTSFLGKERSYNLTHLRMWQKFQYYLICFIDCENDFTPEFYVIDKYIVNKLKLTPMNGTKESNGDNVNIELRSTVKKGGEAHKTIKKSNKLNGTTFNDLRKFYYKVSGIESKITPHYNGELLFM